MGTVPSTSQVLIASYLQFLLNKIFTLSSLSAFIWEMVSDSYNKRQSFYLEGIYFASFSTWDIFPHLRYHRRNQHRNLGIDWILFLLNLLGWHWLIRLYRFQCTFLWYMFCMLHCVPTTQSQILCCHHIFDPLYSLLPPPPCPPVNTILLSVSIRGFFVHLLLSVYVPHMNEIIWLLTFSTGLISLQDDILKIYLYYCEWLYFIFSHGWVVFHCIYVPHLYLIYQRTVWLFPCFGHLE